MAAESEEIIGSDFLIEMGRLVIESDPIVQSVNKYLKDIIRLLSNELPKKQKIRKADQCLIYVKEQYDEWQAECLRRLQNGFNPETHIFALNPSMALQLHTSFSSQSDFCMKRFLKIKKKQAFEVGAQVLDLTPPFGEFEVLRENLDVIKRKLDKLKEIEVQVLSATNPYDLAKASSLVQLIEKKPPFPGSPTVIFLTRVQRDLDKKVEHRTWNMIAASAYPRPLKLLFQGSFQMAKYAASVQKKWLLVNLQSTEVLSSYMLNDTWTHEAVSEIIIANFIFWQAYDDTSEGRKVCTLYNLESIPVVLMINPITGQKMLSRTGMNQLAMEVLVEELLLPFLECRPQLRS